MRVTKMIGLALVAALAAMAVIGASSASAVVLCKTNKNPCPAGEAYAATQLIHGTATEPTLVSNLGTVKCEKSLVHIDGVKDLGSVLDGLLLELSFTNCKLGKTNCTVTTEHLPYLILLSATSGGNGTQVAEADGNGNPRALLDCGVSALKCFFGAATTSLAVTGGNPAVAKAEGVEFEREGGSGFLCPAESKWFAEYKLTEPTGSVFVEAS